MKREAKIATQAELNKVAQRIKKSTVGFGKAKVNRFGKSAQARLNAFVKKVRV